MNRFSAHRKALAAILFAGTARNHRGNLAASLQTEKTYASPVLFSGLGSLVLSKSEVNMIDQHYISTLRKLLKSHAGTPQVFVLFLSGSLPGKALLHLRQLSLFSMITRLPNNPLFSRAKHALTTTPFAGKSWFTEIRLICQLYSLPHPLELLTNPMDKNTFKRLVKSKVTDYWEIKLRQEAALLPSLAFFKPQFHSLTSPHPILWSPGANPHEVTKSVIQLKMLSGRYRVAVLTKHWSSNKSGLCPAPNCTSPETLEHLLVLCPHYSQLRAGIVRLWTSTPDPLLLQIISRVVNSPPQELVQFILDPSVHPLLIALVQTQGLDTLRLAFHLTRTWCYSIHCERLKIVRRFRFDKD